MAGIRGLVGQFAQGPDVTGAIGRGAQVGGQLAQLAAMQRQNQAAETVDRLLAEGAAEPGARQAAIGEAARAGGAGAATGLIDAFSALDAPERERQAREAAILAREMAGATDQASWDAMRQRLAANPEVDATDIPEAFDPNFRTSVINGAREVADIFEDVRSPEAQAQAIERAQAGRAQGGTTIINAGPQGQDFGDPPKDTVWARNPDGSVATRPITLPDGTQALQPISIPIVGGEVDLAQREAERAETERQAGAERRASTVSRSVRNVRRFIDEADLPTTGLTGTLLSNVGGTNAREIAAELETIEALISFGALQEMRDSSESGAALGSVQVKELELLAATLGNIQQSRSEEELLRNLDQIDREFQIMAAGTPEERDALVAQFEASQSGGDVMPDRGNMPRPTTQEGYDALPDGAWYIDPNGVVGRKGSR